MKIRIMGTRAETDDAVKVLRLAFDVLEVSDFRPNRRRESRDGRVYVSRLGRVYVEANPPADPLPGT
ncbi:hypothetical protein AMES_0358 [Amycolatopsis mediterranei S699]|uniref:Uncharacterized protein n=2 Tax=Amycolatopsis mediterranei TaxID=33910 RepID=A0A0H3CW69_AMYMU|nr:hypothetical protein [Amycolatopsis mediterranei]ADJ42179.1 hypothetical protein AMED_0357 [Amycolatopsis mediterranei U32]AEK38856.1 hypothetical protein RAM_01820 [Amycolatopsis mediterranei S699]AFO73894.1 hypothetical protein AMES_0358 [Amycolatopsis mediterranei S699]AGT81023.1 hypothetical protein B737_0359 [Amycolatopsis mediterranei RB]KDO08382.1 hypothetical protein DV26_23515 [Amycolatopsis mediterranei]